MDANVKLKVVSFGYEHSAAPRADVTLDVREWFRDPHVSPEMRNMTGLNAKVYRNVTTMEGVIPFLDGLRQAVHALVELDLGVVTVAFGCVGGRHRSVALAIMLGEWGEGFGWRVEVEHRDVKRDVLTTTRATSAADRR